MAITLDGTNGLTLPTWTTGTRPATPANGQFGFNSTLGYIEWYSQSYNSWIGMNSAPQLSIDMLIIGGGGGGGSNAGGGGGAGGFRLFTGVAATLGTQYGVIVGAGGIYENNGTASSFAANGTFVNYTSAGGGKGGSRDSGGGSNGGSGGGCSVYYPPNNPSGNVPGTGNVPFASPAQGFNGGPLTYTTDQYSTGGASGGGGAGAIGGTGTTSAVGAGGAGAYSSISGANTAYAGGGGGGIGTANLSGGAGGIGGGGAGTKSGNAVSGSVNTGGGGGGGGGSPFGNGGTGGSGIVIITYVSSSQRATGGTVTSYVSGSNTNWVHTFTSSGTFALNA